MHRQIAARLITGPVAFAVGGVIEVLGYAVASLVTRARSARGSRPGR